jgi:iron(III) transport system ATP-binding protein
VSGPASRPAAVALEGIAKKFGQFVALRGITLSIPPGEFVCFLGPSGCGKTTLLRIIAGLERQNAGIVMMGGRDVSALPPSQRNYGIVFQSYALFPNLTVARNVAYGLETRNVARPTSTSIRRSSRAASSSASRWPGRSRRRPRCSCWTSRSRPWTPACASRSATRSARCSGASASPPSW